MEESSKIVYRDKYNKLPLKIRQSIRDEFMNESGMVYPTFYSKLKRNDFRPLELKALEEITLKYTNQNM